MHLTNAQLQQLKTAINADPALSSQPLTSAGALAISDAMNLTASPDFQVWARDILISKIGTTVSYVAVAAMTTANQDKIKTFYVMNPSSFNGRADIRTYFSDTFSGALGGEGANTRAALDLLLYRKATRFERVFATGTGTTVSPGDLVVVGPCSSEEVQLARELP